LTKYKDEDVLMSISYLIYPVKLDKYYPPAYVVGRMIDEGILDTGAFYDI
jgi:hypothetical protein